MHLILTAAQFNTAFDCCFLYQTNVYPLHTTQIINHLEHAQKANKYTTTQVPLNDWYSYNWHFEKGASTFHVTPITRCISLGRFYLTDRIDNEYTAVISHCRDSRMAKNNKVTHFKSLNRIWWLKHFAENWSITNKSGELGRRAGMAQLCPNWLARWAHCMLLPREQPTDWYHSTYDTHKRIPPFKHKMLNYHWYFTWI